MEAGLSVVHVSLEMNLGTVLGRYDRRLSGLLEKQIAAKRVAVSRKLKSLNLLVASYPAFQLTPSQLLTAISRHGRPDLVVVDYGMIMKSDVDSDLRRFQLAEIYAGLRDLGIRQRCAVWTAIQVNRSAYSKTLSEGDVISLEHIAESFEVGAHADVVVSWNQTLTEHQQGEGRIWLDKNREARSKEQISVHADWQTSTIKEK